MPLSLPPAVAQFIETNLRTADDIHFLEVAAADRERWWDAAAVSRELGLHEPEARRLLEHLAARNLLDIRVTADVRYQYRPGSAELAAAAEAALAAFKANPAAVWRALVRKGGGRAIRDFTDAFRIRRDDR